MVTTDLDQYIFLLSELIRTKFRWIVLDYFLETLPRQVWDSGYETKKKKKYICTGWAKLDVSALLKEKERRWKKSEKRFLNGISPF
jgi:hypothetical protein